MTMLKNRLDRLEKEKRFLQWFYANDTFSRCTEEELKTYLETQKWPDWVLCGAIDDRTSELDGLDRKTLLKLFEEDERLFGNLSKDEVKVYVEHGTLPGLGREETAKHSEVCAKRREDILRRARRQQ